MSSVPLKSFATLVSDIKSFYTGHKPVEEERAEKFLNEFLPLTNEFNRKNTRHIIRILNIMCEFEGITLKEVVAFKNDNIAHALSHLVKAVQPEMVQFDVIEHTWKAVPNNTVVVFYDEVMLVKNTNKYEFEPASVVTKELLLYGNYRYGFEGEEHYILGTIPE